MSKIQAAVIGSGFIGPVHVEALRRAGIPVVGILDADPQRSREAAARLQLPKAYAELDELLDDDQVQAVHIAVPNRFHYDMAKKSLANGKHVLCEKPLAMDSRESAELVKLAGAVRVRGRSELQYSVLSDLSGGGRAGAQRSPGPAVPCDGELCAGLALLRHRLQLARVGRSKAARCARSPTSARTGST